MFFPSFVEKGIIFFDNFCFLFFVFVFVYIYIYIYRLLFNIKKREGGGCFFFFPNMDRFCEWVGFCFFRSFFFIFGFFQSYV